MSPEQGQGLPVVDHRTDLYAMGILLYRLLAGRVPFQAATPLDTILQHMNAPVPSPSTFNPELSPLWDTVIQRSLAKAPDDRYASARAMDEAVQETWQRVRRGSGQWAVPGGGDPRQLYERALSAWTEGDWPRVIGLCGEILRVAPEHPDVVQLLTRAHEALRRQQADQQGAPAPERRDLPAPPAALTVRQGDQLGRVYPIDEGVAILGRASNNHVQLQDSLVSRRHCQIQWDGGAYRLEDLGSRNGTYVNGASVPAAELRSGDLIQLGETVLEFALIDRARLEEIRARERGEPPAGEGQSESPTERL
jgi:pSer/pThr/pTyr-binding forkhead associated (FHA) protein